MYFHSVFIYYLLSLFIIQSGNKAKSIENAKLLEQTAQYAVIDNGQIAQTVTNGITSRITNSSYYETFAIGSQSGDQNFTPSMQWRNGGYEKNNYLYDGHFFVGCGRKVVRFSTETSNDFTVVKNDPTATARYNVSFSMTDDSAGADCIGLKTICTVMGWPEPYRYDYLIYRYDIINRSASLLEDVYTAIRYDFDISRAGGGTGFASYYYDDMVDYYLGEDKKGNPESISYMYDANSPDIPGDDTGGHLDPKESLGYIGSRILQSPETKNEVPANQ